MIGAQEENCNLIRIGRDTWIKSITVRHDGIALRSITISRSDGKVATYGRTESDRGFSKLTEQVVNLG